MRAAIYKGASKLAIECVPEPEPRPGDLLIKVHRCGICGTDLYLTSGQPFDYGAGAIPGHEYAGEVVAVGREVTGFKAGDLVTALPSLGCGQCPACDTGNIVLCRKVNGEMGGYAEYLRAPANLSVKLPKTLSLADGALIEPLAVGLYGVRQANMQRGDRVLVLGAGAVALNTIYWARHLGAGRIVAASRSPRRADLTRQMGADAYVAYGDTEVQEVIAALGGPPDIVFECVGVPGVLGRAIQHVRQFGQIISMGFCVAPDGISTAAAGMKAVKMQFCIGYTLKDFEYAARTMDKGHADPKAMITSVVTLDELPAKFAALRGPNTDTKVHVTIA